MSSFPGSEDLGNFLWFSAGSLMIALSSGIGLIAAFEGMLVSTYICLIGFIVGYRVVQLGLQSDRSPFSYFRNSNFSGRLSSLDYLSLVGGSIIMAASFSLLAEGIVLLDVLKSFSAAVMMGSGYMVVHWSINKTLV